MKIFNSILFKMIFLLALFEFSFMILYEYFVPLKALVEKYTILGPIINVIVLALLVVVAYLRVLKKPLDELIEVMNAVEKRDFKRANDKRKDELGIVAAHFNNMSDKLKNWGSELEKNVQERTEELNTANEELKSSNEEIATTNEELRVTTEELEQSNKELKGLKEGLEQKVEERTRETTEAKQALEKKVVDLERFNKLSVGRELAMKELKARIAELEAKISHQS